MALARNLKVKKTKKKLKLPTIKGKFLLLVVLVVFVFGGYGVYNLTKIAPAKKEEVRYDSTGDQPLPQKLMLWVKADGGLYQREEPNSKAKIIKLIPDGTQLEADETQGDWYKVTYQDKSGWIHKSFTTTEAPAEDPTKNWSNFKNPSFGYSLRFPKDWVSQDYGANPASGAVSYVAFGAQLSPTLDPQMLPPVIVKVTQKPQVEVETMYKGYKDSVSEATTAAGLAAVKFTYNSESGTQMTAYVLTKGANVFIFEDSGGFSEELAGIVASLNLA